MEKDDWGAVRWTGFGIADAQHACVDLLQGTERQLPERNRGSGTGCGLSPSNCMAAERIAPKDEPAIDKAAAPRNRRRSASREDRVTLAPGAI